ncbi:kinase-like protein [Gigaspora margarita]|uniref:Kinase-like protein n=1 Tax=Gigaspora margarita TaxID=4874 RepID=A0A8H3WYF3_GIGMA|nr:kinase-like protein [Gigaspora margarita]
MIKQIDYLKQQAEELIVQLKIKEFDFSKLENREKIASGGFSFVYSIVFEGNLYALKCINKMWIKLLRNVNHPNVIKFYGISRAQIENAEDITLVLQLANGGNLRDHLAKKQQMGLYKISWIELIQIAMNITNGLNYLHDNDIIHQDLHSKNILINDGNALISDFGNSQNLNDPFSLDGSVMVGITPYIDPQCFTLETEVKRDKISDIYSLGVLFWELTSGIPPFSNFRSNQYILSRLIVEGLRESIVRNTPLDYTDLYKQCWSFEKNQRPTLDIVLNKLKKLQTKKIEFITNIIKEQRINKQWIKHFFLNRDIREALDISDTAEKIKILEEKFNSYGEYVAVSVTVGGIITIKNWSEIDDESKSRLKVYLQLSIDYAKGLRLKNFENMPIDDLHMFVNSKSIQTAGDLYKWVRDLHNDNSKCLEIISYEKFKPTFQLLPEDLIKKIFEYSNVQYLDESKLISKLQSQYDKTKGLEWISSSELPLCIFDWVQDYLLQHGIILLRSKPARAKKAAIKLLKEPKITPINKITIILTQPKTHQEAYLLENGMILKEEDNLEFDKIPFTEHSSMFNIPFEDFTNSNRLSSNAIYCQIIFHTIKLSFDVSDIEYSQEFLNAVNSARQDSESSNILCKLFGNDYGQLLPRTFTLGGVLSKKYISSNHPIGFTTQKLDLNYNDSDAIQIIEQLLEKWNKEFNTLYFLNNEGDVIYRNKIGDWLNALANNPKHWNIISSEDWMQIYNATKQNT